MKIALVYDRINKYGGAERVLEALHEIWPEAPVYSAVYDPQRAAWCKGWEIRTTFLQYLPFAKSHHELYPWLTQMAFETLNFDEFEAVLSVTSAEAKAVITKPGTIHVCYCLTPTRYLWSGYETYTKEPGWGEWGWLASKSLSLMGKRLKVWDKAAAARPDYYVAISQRVAGRIEKYYGRRSEVIIYPPVEIEKFNLKRNKVSGEYFLAVSRLVGYKRLDLLVEVCSKHQLPLVIIGSGWAERNLRKLAGSSVTFVTRHLTDAELSRYYQNCLAFLHAGDEDFGIAAVEAQASGKPVIAWRESGVAEIVREGETGRFFSEQTSEAVARELKKFKAADYSAEECRKNALRFSKERFKREMKETITRLAAGVL